MLYRICVTILICFFSSSILMSDYELLKNNSFVGFNIEQFGLGLVEGQFHDIEISLEEIDKNLVNIAATLNVKSLKTGNKTRDRHLQKEEIFNTEKFKYIVFKSSNPVPLSASKIQGELSLKGVTHLVEIPVTFNVKNTQQDSIIKATAVGFELLRSDYNMISHKYLINNSVISKIDVTFKQNE